ncbi:hypothetical protein [Streptomyces sp. NPDC001205]
MVINGVVLLAWHPGEHLRPGHHLREHGLGFDPHPEPAGIRDALYLAVTEILAGAGYQIGVHHDGWLRITRGAG